MAQSMIDGILTGPQYAKTTLAASIFGGLISWNWANDMNAKQKLVSMVCGSIMADYAAPVVVDLFSDGKYIGFVAFMIGMFGMSVVGLIFKMLRETSASDVWGMVERLIGKLIDKIPSKDGA